MSYTRNYHETLVVEGSKSINVSYPASQNGGSQSVVVDYVEHVPVNVSIEVDTNPFDSSVERCNANVNILTGAVAATEVAQIIAIENNSQKVGSTIVSGFFSYIRSEISQQIAELSQTIEAQLMHLKELTKSCISKKVQMEGDYNRIAGRYVKTFEDLNGELSNRIHELDKPTFLFKIETDKQQLRSTCNEMVNTVAIFGNENSDLQSKISISIAKKRAVDTLNKMKLFLWQQKQFNNTIQQNMLSENISCSKYLPVCFIETKNKNNEIDGNVFLPEFLTPLNNKSTKNDLTEMFKGKIDGWAQISEEHNNNVKIYFNSELNNSYLTNDRHSERLKEMILRLANINNIAINN
jgi:hypothetical protein